MKRSNGNIAKAIIRRLEYDIEDRRGLKGEWALIERDIKRELKAEWHRLIMEELGK